MDSDVILTAVNAAESVTNVPRKPERSSYRARKTMEGAIHLIFLLCGIVAVAFVLFISIYLILSGLPAIRQIGLVQFLFGKVWDPTNTTTGAQYGIFAFILTSVYGTAGAIVVGVPIGLMTAVFLAKVAPPKLAAVIRTAVQLLAGIPSVAPRARLASSYPLGTARRAVSDTLMMEGRIMMASTMMAASRQAPEPRLNPF